MKRFLSIILMACGLASAQSTTTVTASGLPSGANQMCFLGTDANNNPITYTPSGGSPTTGAVCYSVTSGTLAGSSTVANAATASPSGLVYRVTIINGNTVYLTIPQVPITGSVFNFNTFGLSSNMTAVGIGLPTIACSYGASYTATNFPDGQNGLFCNTNGQWQGQPANPYCPIGQAYIVPTATGKPSCLPPATEGLGPPKGLCFEKQRYTQADGGAAADWGCVNQSWVHLSGPVGPTGPAGPAGPIGGSLSYPGVTTNGANGLNVAGGVFKGGSLYLVCAGNSRPAGSNVGPGEDFCTAVSKQPQIAANLIGMHNAAIGGSSVDAALTYYTTDIFPFRPAITGATYTPLLIQYGANEAFGSRPLAQTQMEMTQLLNQAVTDGFSPILITEFYATAQGSPLMNAFSNWELSLGYPVFDTRAFITPSVLNSFYGYINPYWFVGSYTVAAGGSITVPCSSGCPPVGTAIEFSGMTANPAATVQGVRTTVATSGGGYFTTAATGLAASTSPPYILGTAAEYAPVTAFSIASGVATFMGAQTCGAGNTLHLSGFAAPYAYLNGFEGPILATGLSTSQFEVALPFADVSATVSGVAEQYISDSVHLLPSGYAALARNFNSWWGAAASGLANAVISPINNSGVFQPTPPSDTAIAVYDSTGVQQAEIDGICASGCANSGQTPNTAAIDATNTLNLDAYSTAGQVNLQIARQTKIGVTQNYVNIYPGIYFYTSSDSGGVANYITDSGGTTRGTLGAMGTTTPIPAAPPTSLFLESITGPLVFDSINGTEEQDFLIHRNLAAKINSSGLAVGGGSPISNTSTVPRVGTPTAGQVACVKSVTGTPAVVTFGFCSGAVSGSSSCTCN